jgi:hypothetical protein
MTTASLPASASAICCRSPAMGSLARCCCMVDPSGLPRLQHEKTPESSRCRILTWAAWRAAAAMRTALSYCACSIQTTKSR